LNYMIPKRTSNTSAPDSTYEVQKIKIYSYKENISSIQNYQGLFLYLVTCQVQLSANYYCLTLMVSMAKSSTLTRVARVQIHFVKFIIF
jgi:hypothetical protein